MLGDSAVGRWVARQRERFASPLVAITFGLTSTAFGLLLRLLMNDPEPRFVTLYPAVAIAALIGGPLSGLVATLVAAAATEFFFFEPILTLTIAGWGDALSIANFTITGLLICLIAAVDQAIAARMVRATAERDAAEARHRTIVDALNEGVIVFGRGGEVLSYNPSAERILGFEPGTLVSTSGNPAEWWILRSDGSRMAIAEYPVMRAFATGRACHDEIIGHVHGDRTVWLLNNAVPLPDPATGAVSAAIISFVDITARLSAERALAESRAHLHSVLHALHEGVVVFDAEGRTLSCNRSAETILRRTAAEMIGVNGYLALGRRTIRPDGSPFPLEERPIRGTLRTGIAARDVVAGIVDESGTIWLQLNAEAIRDPRSGAVVAAVASFTDITERLRRDQELAESRARFASIVSSAMDAIVTVDADQRVVLFNAAAERMFGIREAEALGQPLDTFVPEGAREVHHRGFAAFAAGSEGARMMGDGLLLTARRADGSEFPIEASISRVDVDGKPLFTVIHRDITARLKAERINAQLATVVRSSPDAILTVSMDGKIATWNEAATRMFGYTEAEAVGASIGMLSYPDRPDNGRGIYLRVREGEAVKLEAVRRRADGTPIEVLSSAAPIRDSTGEIVAGVAILSDIGVRKEKERQLLERDQELRQTLDAAGLGVWWIDVAAAEMHCDPRSRTLFGVEESAPLSVVADRFHAEDRIDFLSIRDTLAAPHVDHPLVLRAFGRDDTTIWLSLTARLRRTPADAEEIWGTVQDVTEQHEAEEALKQLEASRRLEALGRMTGGIAHDFNNLLTIISGNLQLLDLSPGDAGARQWIAEALRATESGAALNNRLITFARQRRLDPTICDLNDVVGSMIDLLHRSVGARITVAAVLGADLGAVRVDPSEIENAVLNLVFNARDAMPSGGRILIETRNVAVDEAVAATEMGARPGPHVRLTVSDTGTGMAAEVKARAFEPFFTTKEVGRGSGLGLATLHGFVRQSGGFVTLYSEVGHGTTVNIYLPRVEAETGGPIPAPTTRLVPGAGETILLVEDNPDVADVTARRLVTLGYVVRSAPDAAGALAVLAEGAAIDLVFTDVIMPGGMSGLDLARRLRARDPARRLLLTSGFAEELARGEEADALEFPVLRKPYAMAELSRAVAEALGRDPTAPKAEDGEAG